MDSYSEPPSAATGALKAIAWILIGLGTAALVFLFLLQTMMVPASLLESVLFFLAFGLLEAGAIWAASRRLLGVSIALGAFVALSLGAISLGLLVFGFAGL